MTDTPDIPAAVLARIEAARRRVRDRQQARAEGETRAASTSWAELEILALATLGLLAEYAAVVRPEGWSGKQVRWHLRVRVPGLCPFELYWQRGGTGWQLCDQVSVITKETEKGFIAGFLDAQGMDEALVLAFEDRGVYRRVPDEALPF